MSTLSRGPIRNRWSALALALLAAAGVAQAAPASADTTAPAIELFTADGLTPLGDTVVHPGDRIVVRGRGFDPAANTGGLPLPIPPGVPHGTFVTFGAFSPQWRPSEGAPGSARSASRSTVQWILSDSALGRVPQAPFDLQRTVRKQWVPLADDGTFTATLEVARPTAIPADAVFGVYTYAAAESVNAAQELAVPVRFDASPGVNTPRVPSTDLSWAVAPGFAGTVTGPLQGTLTGSGGAAVRDGVLTFELDDGAVDGVSGFGIVRYRGTVVASTRFHLGEIALANPWIEFTSAGAWLSVESSTSDTVGADSLRRIRIARLAAEAEAGRSEWESVPAVFESGLSPVALAVLGAGRAESVSFGW